ncbi:MAG: sigma-70 family RNA polymerase sigma factor [Candidatus Omnitrophica bacterium]|nr:sigma-70 family RNA polymerase sigma factor [Candidatus Omnitrophota bacterium]
MMSPSYKGLFEGWEIAIAKKLINDFKKQWRCLESDDFDDLLQECLTQWFYAKDKYNPEAEASEKTFMARVVKNKLFDIVKGHERLRRKDSQKTDSLDQPLSDEDDAPTLLDTLSTDENYATNLRFHTELKIDISHTSQKLTPKQQELCQLLGEKGLSIKEASKILKTPRGTIYEEIKRIKAIFQKENLHEYLG